MSMVDLHPGADTSCSGQPGTVLMLPVPNNLEIRDEVNTFLASLPLGASRRDAQVEDAIARQLYALLNTRADLQLKLNQW